MDKIQKFETTRTCQGYETGIHYYWEPNTMPPFWKSQEELTIFEHIHNSGSWILSSDMLPHPPIRVVSSAYLRLLIFLPAILIPACVSSSPAFLMMYSACKLNKQGDNIQPWQTPFPIWNQSVVPCPVLTVASWPAYKFLKRQIRWSGITNSWRIFHSLLWSTQSKALA